MTCRMLKRASWNAVLEAPLIHNANSADPADTTAAALSLSITLSACAVAEALLSKAWREGRVTILPIDPGLVTIAPGGPATPTPGGPQNAWGPTLAGGGSARPSPSGTPCPLPRKNFSERGQ